MYYTILCLLHHKLHRNNKQISAGIILNFLLEYASAMTAFWPIACCIPTTIDFDSYYIWRAAVK